MVIKLKNTAGVVKIPRYRFSSHPNRPKADMAQQQIQTPPAVQEQELSEEALAELEHRKRVERDQLRETPPNIPFLHFDSIVGRGGMAVVWKAWHKALDRFVAVKVLDNNFAATGKDVRQFMMEVRTMTDLHHPGIVQGYGADCADGRYYFIMDYVGGYTFGTLLNRKRKLPQSDVLIICESVADAMKYAWDSFGIVHCDLKPDNIMVDRDGTIKVMDLGLCQSTAALQQEGQLEEVVGTPAYISPEQIYGDTELDCRADIYCLGATLYHLVTGRMLFPILSNDDILRAHVDPEKKAPDPRILQPGITENFCRFLAGLLVKDRDWRYQTWDDVFNAARMVENDEMLPPLPPEAISSVEVN